MWALAAGSAFANRPVSQHPHITTITYFTDNQAAVRSIIETADHPAQRASIKFRRNVDELLRRASDNRVEVIWVPGHQGFAENERADALANRGAEPLDDPLLHSTISWARERSKAPALSTWRREWASL
ncbi:hypothetical protein K523DRAFT_402374, partial [Schizophyllum commune Tattone D]